MSLASKWVLWKSSSSSKPEPYEQFRRFCNRLQIKGCQCSSSSNFITAGPRSWLKKVLRGVLASAFLEHGHTAGCLCLLCPALYLDRRAYRRTHDSHRSSEFSWLTSQLRSNSLHAYSSFSGLLVELPGGQRREECRQ